MQDNNQITIGLLPVNKIAKEDIGDYSDIDMVGMNRLGDIHVGLLKYTDARGFYIEDVNDFRHLGIIYIIRKVDFQRLPIINKLPTT